MAGLLSTMNIGKSAINVAQAQINVTTHNMSNASTTGYTRQRANVVTSRPTAVGECAVGQIGTGSQVQSIERLRSTYLDHQLREAYSGQNSASIVNDTLSQVESIFNEPSTTGISNALSEFYASFEELSKSPSSSSTRTVVAQTTRTLTDRLNDTANKLESLKKQTQDTMKTYVTQINRHIDSINNLNKEIMQASALGQSPNDLLDKRDTEIDNLSALLGVTVTSAVNNGIELSPSDTGSMVNTSFVSSYAGSTARVSFISSVEKDANNPDVTVIKYYKLGNSADMENLQTLRVSGLSDEQRQQIENSRILWADESGQATKADGYPIRNNELISSEELMLLQPTKGNVGGAIEVQGYIQNYMDHLDSLAKAVAFTVNTVHSGMIDPLNGTNPKHDYVPFFVNGDVASYDSGNKLENLEKTLLAESNITAKNISINYEIEKDPMKIKTKIDDYLYADTSLNPTGEGSGKRAEAIAALKDVTIKIQDFGLTINSRADLFTQGKGGVTLNDHAMKISSDSSGMTIGSYYSSILNKLAVEKKSADESVTNFSDNVQTINNNIAQISGVSMDEELANLIQYQHSYTASAKIISTVDSLLDVIINGLIR